MRKSGVKFFSVALSVSLIASLFIGCQSKQNSKDQSASSTVGPAATLTVEIFDRGKSGQPPLDNNFWTKWVNDNFGAKNNCHVQYIPIPRSQEVDKLNVLMAANQAPDICFTYDSGLVYNYVTQGGLTQLDDILAKDGKNLTKYLGNDVLKYGQFNGKQFSVPAKRTILMIGNTFIRKDWLDKLGMALPKSRDDFYKALVAFKEKNPGGVSDVVPMAYAIGSSSNIGTGNLTDSFYKKMSEADLAATTYNNVTDMTWKRDGYKDYIKFMNKLYNEGLISKDFAIDKTAANANADVSNGKAGVVCANWDYIYRASPGIYTTLKKNVPSAQLVPVDCFQNSEGKYAKKIYSANGAFLLIPKSSKNASLAIKYLDWMSDTKVTMFLQNGQEGTDYTLTDGIPVPKNPSTLTGDKQIAAAYNGDYDMLTNGPECGDTAKNEKAIASGYPGFEEDAKTAAKIGMNDGYTGFYFSIPNASYAKYSKTLDDKNIQMTAKLITCQPSQFDSLYDSQLAEYMTAGAQAVMDENIKNYKTQTGK